MLAVVRGFVAVTTRTARHITILRHDRHDTDDNGMPFPSEGGPTEKKPVMEVAHISETKTLAGFL